MMETKRDRQWRRKQGFRVFKNRLKAESTWISEWVMDDGRRVYRPRWHELAQCRWACRYKTTGTPCSCPLCRGESYDRRAYKKETRRIVDETME